MILRFFEIVFEMLIVVAQSFSVYLLCSIILLNKHIIIYPFFPINGHLFPFFFFAFTNNNVINILYIVPCLHIQDFLKSVRPKSRI